MQPVDFFLGKVEQGKALLALRGVDAAAQRANIEGRRFERFEERHVVQLRVVGERDDGGVAVDTQFHDHIVRHAPLEAHACDAKPGRELFARVDDDDLVVRADGHRGHVLREVSGAHHHQSPARAVDGPHDAPVEAVGVFTRCVLQRCPAALHVEYACGQELGGDAVAQRAQRFNVGLGLDHQPQGAAAGQPEAGGLVLGDAIEHDLR